jgi:hypothetical protein
LSRCAIGNDDRRAADRGGPSTTVTCVPRHWIWMQVAIIVFVLAGMVIAITKLA